MEKVEEIGAELVNESALQGDELTGTEQGHFDEFATVEQMAADIEGVQLGAPSTDAGYQPAEATVSGAELVLPIVTLACAVLAPSWNVGAQEQAALADSYGAVIDKYFPDGAGQFGVELSALLVTAAIVTPRLGTPRKPEPKEEKSKDAKATD